MRAGQKITHRQFQMSIKLRRAISLSFSPYFSSCYYEHICHIHTYIYVPAYDVLEQKSKYISSKCQSVWCRVDRILQRLLSRRRHMASQLHIFLPNTKDYERKSQELQKAQEASTNEHVPSKFWQGMPIFFELWIHQLASSRIGSVTPILKNLSVGESLRATLDQQLPQLEEAVALRLQDRC